LLFFWLNFAIIWISKKWKKKQKTIDSHQGFLVGIFYSIFPSLDLGDKITKNIRNKLIPNKNIILIFVLTGPQWGVFQTNKKKLGSFGKLRKNKFPFCPKHLGIFREFQRNVFQYGRICFSLVGWEFLFCPIISGELYRVKILHFCSNLGGRGAEWKDWGEPFSFFFILPQEYYKGWK
jgi:hypothetical protein